MQATALVCAVTTALAIAGAPLLAEEPDAGPDSLEHGV